jgi:hypothetical protein
MRESFVQAFRGVVNTPFKGLYHRDLGRKGSKGPFDFRNGIRWGPFLKFKEDYVFEGFSGLVWAGHFMDID